MWRDMLINHINLSEAYAEDYDSTYGSVVTRNYMEYERERLHEAADLVDKGNRILAVDIGCGTGRCTLDLCRHFANVVGIDFSPKMLHTAIKNAKKENIANVSFDLRDVSTSGLGSFSMEASFINFAFGMGSFFEDVDLLLSEIKRVLSKKGVFHVTFYNKDSFICKASSSVDMGTSAIPFPDSDHLLVDSFEVPCRFYTPEDIRHLFGNRYLEVSFSTYPTILPLVKEELLSFPEILDYCKALDIKATSYNKGYYISAIYQNV